MEHDEYLKIVNEAAAAHQAGRTSQAAEAFRRLAEDTTLPDLDRAVMAMDLAIVLQSVGVVDGDVEAAYDLGISLESCWYRGQVAEAKAVWLAQIGRRNSAAGIYQTMAQQGWATSEERQRWSSNAAALTQPTE